MTSFLSRPAVRDAVLPISVEQYHRLGEAGIIDEKTELLRGFIVRKMIKSPRHSWFVQKLAAVVSRSLDPTSCFLRQEQPLSLADSEPEPDLAVVVGQLDDYRAVHPSTARLVIEVAVTSEELDREKADLYAAAAVDEYWLILDTKQVVEKYTAPGPDGYADRQLVDFDSLLASDAVPSVQVDLRLFVT